MKEPSIIYNEAYVSKIVKKSWRYIQAPLQVNIMVDHFDPYSVIDIGAANGLHTNAFISRGCATMAIEGTEYFEVYLKENSTQYRIHDLREPLRLCKMYDLLHSAEVLEHIEEEYVDVVLKSICMHSDTLFITASPEKGGVAHVNPQPKEYWIERFSDHGFKYCKEETERIASEFTKLDNAGWYVIHSGIYRRR